MLTGCVLPYARCSVNVVFLTMLFLREGIVRTQGGVSIYLILISA